MLTLDVVIDENFDEATSEFVKTVFTLTLEHSLVSLSKWESEFEKPFLSDVEKTPEETIRYFELTVTTPNVPPEIFSKISNENIAAFNEYIVAKQTATTFHEAVGSTGTGTREVITAEIMYYWLVTLNIPFDCQYWHLNRLIALVKTCNLKNQPAKKMPRREMIDQRRAINAKRQQELGTRG